MARVAKVCLALFLVVSLCFLVYFAHHKKRVTYQMTWYNANETRLGSELPPLDPFGNPKTIVLARSVPGAVCYEAYYSDRLKRILNSSTPKIVEVTYLITYSFGKPAWIEELDIQHLGPIAPAEYAGQSPGGIECF